MAIRPTSKVALKQQCLLIAKGDLKKAAELYDYFAKDLDGLPNFDVVPPSWSDAFGHKVNDVFNWVRDNQDVLGQGYGMLRDIIQRKTIQAAEDVTNTVDPLPPINQ